MHNQTTNYYDSAYGFKIHHVISDDISKISLKDWHYDTYLVLAYFKKSMGKFKIEGNIYNINDGDMIILNYNEIHFVDLIEQPGERITLYIKDDIFSSYPKETNKLLDIFMLKSPGINNYIPRSFVEKSGIDIILENAVAHLSENNEIANLLAFTKIVELLSILNSSICLQPVDSFSFSNTTVKKILKYINETFLEDITIDYIAHEMGISKYYMCRLFKDNLGISIWDYVINRRILHFNELIRGGSNIENAAFYCGFKNYSNFYRLYKKRMNISPSEFKQKHHPHG